MSSAHTHDAISLFFGIGSILAFVLFFYILNLFESFEDIYKIFGIVFTNTLCYIALFFVGGACILIDNGLHLIHYEIRLMLEA